MFKRKDRKMNKKFLKQQLDNAESEHRMISKALIEQETKVLIRKYGTIGNVNIGAMIFGVDR